MNNASKLRAPAVPLVVHDPFFSYWLPSENATAVFPSHWTGTSARWDGEARIDGKPYIFLGCGISVTAERLKDHTIDIYPTRTVITYKTAEVRMRVTYLTPVLPHDLELMARSATYVTTEVESLDGKEHKVEVAFYYSGAACVDRTYNLVNWGRTDHPDCDLGFFTAAQPHMLQTCGDDQRIDWGSFYIAVPYKYNAATRFVNEQPTMRAFAADGSIPAIDRNDHPKQAYRNGDTPAFMVAKTLECSAGKGAEFRHILAYDDIYALEYLERKVKAAWHAYEPDFSTLLSKVEDDSERVRGLAEDYDAMFMADAAKVGGDKYASLCAISFRQAIGAHKLAFTREGKLLFFSKENFSNGCIATVDVTYPSAPLFLLTNPALLRGMVEPLLEYAATSAWKFDFAPHDLGCYPIANGQVYGGGEESEERQMPVEECGNLLLLSAMLDQYSNGDPMVDKFIDTVLKDWAEYLLKFGFDPEDQLCTDDFAGKLAHNVNLSAKAILALAAYAKLLVSRGRAADAAPYRKAAEEWAKRWVAEADDGDHTRLTFDNAGTWSQKYNLIWDRLLGLGLFPAEVTRREAAWYRKHLNAFGLPLDSRRTYTKLDWTVWCATLTGSREDFDAIMEPTYRWVNETTKRVPLGDWNETVTPDHIRFQARSVVGGVFITMLADPELCAKYAKLLK
ncbi:MAG: DUF4965 domain-containing protein [Lentisphaeria bacterium]|nr:DUF4965 domain-containing protein [Lentisphaeria bacterium]